MRQVRILQQAVDEAIAAANWYDRECDGLGEEFANAVDIAIDLIEEDILPLSPMPGIVGTKGIKRLILKRFPYDIVVRDDDAEIVIIAVAHHSRIPGYWKNRISP